MKHAVLSLLLPIAVLGIIAVSLGGCGGKKEVAPVAVGEMEEYRDQAVGFHIKFPKGWVSDGETGRRAWFFSAQGVKERILDPTGPYPDGAAILVTLTETQSPDNERTTILNELKSQNVVVGMEEPITIGAVQAVRVPTTANYGSGVFVYGHRVYISADTMLYEITFAGINEQYEAHKAVFDACLNTFDLPKPKVPGRDETLPSETMASQEGKFLRFQYPENFNFVESPKGTNDEVISLRGVRQDCSIRFDVFPAKGLTLEKVFDQNKGKFQSTGSGNATIGGQPAKFLTYNAAKEVERRFYFAVRNDKVYRITMDWYKPQRADYLAAYDKVVGSVQFK